MAPVNDLDIVDELHSSYLTYALSVIVSRALPDARDGLKPSQRRILVAMNDLGLGPTASTSKCAGIIGETMKRYHPHGDASIYDSLVRMAQDWNLRYRLIHGQGNFGSIAGLPPAAHRYTEARLTPVAADLLADIDHDTVDFIDNYDGKYREPLVLPAKFPNLLVNGSDGIAVGIATHIPPHNLREVCKALVEMIDNPAISLFDLVQPRNEGEQAILPGPDFPTGGIIMGRQGILDAYATGQGKITLRARIDVVEDARGKTAHLLIREVPFQVSRLPLLEEIGALVKEDRIPNVKNIRDESSAKRGEPVRVVIELTNKGDPHMVRNQLYQFTKLQKTISINMWALADGKPQRLPLLELMRKFLDHRAQVIRRRTEYLLREAKRRAHILEGQLIALADIESVIKICREAPNRSEAKVRLQASKVPAALMERAIGSEAFAALQGELGVAAEYQMTEAQAEAIVRLQLGQLANLESSEIVKEYQGLRSQIREHETLLSDEKNIRAVIRADLEQMAAKYGDDRKTEFSDEGGDVDIEDLIEDEPNVVTITHQQFIKRMPLTEYRVQGRGGKGVQGGLKDEDFVEHFFVASTKAYLLCFTNKGQMYWLKVYKIPTASRTSAGRSIANVLSLKPEEKITSIVPVREFCPDVHLMMATRKGTVKKTELMAYSNVRAGGIIGITIDEGDELIDVCLTQAGDEVVLATRGGMAIRFSEADARSMGRTARGVRGIRVGKGDEVVGMVVADPTGLLLSVTENGYGKRTPFGANTDPATLAVADGDGEAEGDAEPVAEPEPSANGDGEESESDPSGMRYRIQRRGGKGLKDVKVTAKNGKVVGVASVRDGDEIMVITAQGMVTRSKVDTIRTVGRNTQGVKVMTPADGDKIVTVAKVASENVAEPGAAEAG
jgi:DNA gyrase subunit A